MQNYDIRLAIVKLKRKQGDTEMTVSGTAVNKEEHTIWGRLFPEKQTMYTIETENGRRYSVRPQMGIQVGSRVIMRVNPFLMVLEVLPF